MGNSCVAGGWLAYPHRADVVITNHTRYELNLDLDESCGRECNHKGELFIQKLYVFVLNMVPRMINCNLGDPA